MPSYALARFGAPRLLVSSLLGLGALTAACGSEPSGPGGGSGTPSAVRASVPLQIDTIESEPATQYSVEVRNADGLAVGVDVVFAATNMAVAAGTSGFGPSVTVSTDANGRASARVRFGQVTGPGAIVATAAALSVRDSVDFLVEAGAPTTVDLGLADTTVFIGTTLGIAPTAADRLGNVADAAVTVSSGPAVLSRTDVSFGSLGVSVVRAGSGSQADSATVRAIPDGTLVYTDGSLAWLVNFDGSGREQLPFSVPSVREPSVDWSFDGQQIVVGGWDGFRVFDLRTDAVTPATWPGGAAGGEVIWARFKPDGSIVYAQNDGGGWDLRTAAADASAARTIIPAGRFPEEDLQPDWAPDESALVFTSDWEENNKYLLRLSDTLAVSVTTHPVEASSPVWSPDMTMLGYQELGLVGVASPYGTAIARSWFLGWSKGVCWDPDSSLLVGLHNGTIEVVDVVTGTVMAFPELSTSADAVSWRPRLPIAAP